MNTLITNRDVVELAFDGAEYVSPQSITAADIAAATTRFIAPIVGKPLLKALQGGSYAELLEEYVAPALALAVRVMVQSSLNVRLTTAGLTAPSSPTTAAATTAASEAVTQSLVNRLRYLCHRLSEHLDDSAADYPEYDATQNPLNRCTIYGGVVQIR